MTALATARPFAERTFTFGSAMVGIATEPGGGAADATRPAVLILNAGIVHRIGPSRNSVELARSLAREGFLTLRFDLSGIGDSEARRDDLSIEEHAILDVREAMDHLRKTRGIERFVLVGLCSGADNAFRVARQDPAVVGAVLLDGFGYRTRRYYVRYYTRRGVRWQSYRGAATRVASYLLTRARERLERRRQDLDQDMPTKLDVVPQWERVFPSREQFAADLGALVARNVQLLFIYTAGVDRYYNHDGQLAESVPEVNFDGLVDTAYFEDSDHTITELESKARLVATTVTWFRRHFGAPASNDSDAR